MQAKFPEYKGLDLSLVNKDILEKWTKERTFEQSLAIRAGKPEFVFYEGPPSANGMPGIHHVMARSIKDIFCRYKTQKGFLVNRKAGWDTHGLPVELGVEKSLGITKEDIGKKISVEEYNAACRKDVMKYTKEWEDLTRQMGYWVDMKHPYITCDNKYIETLWYLLGQLYNKGLLYKGYTIQPYSPAAGTGLSSHELNQPGCYRDVKDLTAVAMFKLKSPLNPPSRGKQSPPEGDLGGLGCYFLAWTTTPWTLPSNTALCVGANIVYSLVKAKNPYSEKECVFILAKERVSAYFGEKKIENFEIIGEVSGKDLEGLEYEQLIPFAKPLNTNSAAPQSSPQTAENQPNAFRVICGDFVTTEDGTGIVHIAPTFGADDDRVAKQNGIAPMLLLDKNGKRVPMVDLTGKFYTIEDLDADFVKTNVDVELYKNYAGKFVKDAYYAEIPEHHLSLDTEICLWLQEKSLLFKKEKHTHNYPHCWRTDKPVLYYPLDSWFIRTTACREDMLRLNNTIQWKPESTGSGRFGKWLENLQDWNLSRSRFWGTPLPIWRTEDGAEEKCISSVEELLKEIQRAVKAGVMAKNPYETFVVGDFSKENYEKIDLHRPYVDDIVLVSTKGEPMKRETDLIDVWFDSGAMPFAQIHYPFKSPSGGDSEDMQSPPAGDLGGYPADFISEGVDQTRGWFFTLHAISAMIRNSVAFKNVVSTGLVLDKNGVKMSKRLGNIIDPFATIEKYGSDPLRWYMMTNASPWDNLKFDMEGVEEVRRKFFGTLHNTYSFFALYANVDGFDANAPQTPVSERPEIDRWIISLLNTLIRQVDECYANYEPTRAGRLIQDFVTENLSNWYVRLNRKRYWGGQMDADKRAAYQTLYACLTTVAQLAAPIAPFYTDKLYGDLTGNSVSVHLTDFPVWDAALIDSELETRMVLAQTVSSIVLALRRRVNIRVRQPLSKIMIPVLDDTLQPQLEAVSKLILGEVNVKKLEYVTDTGGILVKKIKPNFKTLGPRYSKLMKGISAHIAAFSQQDITDLERTGAYSTVIDGVNVDLTPADVEITSEDIPGWLVAGDGKLTVALDITVTDELKLEGTARELINRIQNLRKDSGFDVTDKISIVLQRHPEIDEAVAVHKDYIMSQVLGVSLDLANTVEGGTEVDMDEYVLRVKLTVNGGTEELK
ncbi:isoleucine--tRNA ligase [Bacteroidia bacterium]|nr:isoleucine--tRNA ligase [Bacteroidia bacterium]